MENKDLAYIIEHNTRVILPNFGAFLQKDSNSPFKPEIITFSPFLKYNDNILEECYAKLKETSKDEAIRQVKLFIEQIKTIIDSGQPYPIEGIGTLSRNDRGAIVFFPEGAPIPTIPSSKPEKKVVEIAKADSNTPNIVKGDAKDAKKTKIEPEPSNKKPNNPSTDTPTIDNSNAKNTSATEPIDIVQVPNKQYTASKPENMPKHKKKSILKTVLLYFGISLAAIIAIAFILREFIQNSGSTPEKTETPIALGSNAKAIRVNNSISTPQPSDEIDKAFETMNPNGNPEHPLADDSMDKVEQSIEQSVIENATMQHQTKEQFHLVVGSFKDMSNAEQYAKQLQNEGYKSTVITQSSGIKSVTIGSFTTKEEANSEKNKLVKKFPSIWIIKK